MILESLSDSINCIFNWSVSLSASPTDVAEEQSPPIVVAKMTGNLCDVIGDVFSAEMLCTLQHNLNISLAAS